MKKNIKLLAILMLSFGLFEAVQANNVTIKVTGNQDFHPIVHRHYKNGSWGKWSIVQPISEDITPGSQHRGDSTYNLSESEHDEYGTINANSQYNSMNYETKSTLPNEHKGNAFKGKTRWNLTTNTIS